MNDDKLGKIVQLAKFGIGGEKAAAMKLVQRICKQRGLDIDRVMALDAALKFCAFQYRTNDEAQIVAQVVFRFTDKTQMAQSKSLKRLAVDLTQAEAVEVEHAVAVYLRAYRKERRKVMKSIVSDLSNGFIVKHQLFSEDQKQQAPKMLTWEQMVEAERIRAMAGKLGDVQLHRPIEASSRSAQ